MTLAEYIQAVEDGKRPKVDFINKIFKLNGEEVEVHDDTAVLRPLEEIEKLYSRFKRSYPSERSEHHMNDYFKALCADELTDEDLVYGEERTVARARLEGSFLCWVLNGSLTWNDDAHWFWQSKSDPDLIILKRWIA